MGPVVPFLPAIFSGIAAVSSVVSGVAASRSAKSQARKQEEQSQELAAEEGRIAESAAASQRARFFASGAGNGAGTAPSRLVAETLSQGRRNISARLTEGAVAAGATRASGRQKFVSGIGGGIRGGAETFKSLDKAGFFQ
jgi:hypothetical protein